MPDVIGLLPDADAHELRGAIRLIEQAELDGVSMLAEEREVDAAAIPGRT